MLTLMFAISDWLGLGDLAKLMITAGKRRIAVFLPRSRIGNPSFRFVGRQKQINATVGQMSVVATLNARPPSEKGETRTVDVELEVQVDETIYSYLQGNASNPEKGNPWPRALPRPIVERSKQPAFEEGKDLVRRLTNYCRVEPNCSQNVVAPAQTTIDDVAEVIIQEPEYNKAKISAPSKTRLNAAQQIYARHEFEMLTGIGTILKCTVLLIELRTQKSWPINHNRLIHSLNEEILFNLQSRWLEELVLCSFDFSITYTKMSENQMADKLSRLYPSDSLETELAEVEFISCGVDITTAIEDTTARWLDMVMGDQNNEKAHTCFVPECLVGRKEGGCMSKTHNNERTSKTKFEKVVMVTAESAIVTHHRSVGTNPDSVPTTRISSRPLTNLMAQETESPRR